jgi:orotate phosphoribosyltransferase
MRKGYKPEIIHDYSAEFLTPAKLRKAVQKCLRVIRKRKLKFDAIAFRGLSGAVVAPMVALALKKTMIAVRKNRSHGIKVCGDLGAQSYLIIDDLISSGETVRTIVTDIERASLNEPTCVGVVFYTRYNSFRKVKSNGDLDV